MSERRIERAEGRFAVNDTSLEGGRKQNLFIWTSHCDRAMFLSVPKTMAWIISSTGSAIRQAPCMQHNIKSFWFCLTSQTMPEKPESIWIFLSSPNVYTTPCVEPSNGFRDVFPSRLNLLLPQSVQETMKNWASTKGSLGLHACRTRIKGDTTELICPAARAGFS